MKSFFTNSKVNNSMLKSTSYQLNQDISNQNLEYNMQKLENENDQSTQLPVLLNMIQNDIHNQSLYKKLASMLNLKQLKVPTAEFFANSLYTLSKIQSEIKNTENELVKYRKLARVRGFSSRHVRCIQMFRSTLSDISTLCSFNAHEYIDQYKQNSLKSKPSQIGSGSQVVSMNANSYIYHCYVIINLKQRAQRIQRNIDKIYTEALLYVQEDNLISVFSSIMISIAIISQANNYFQEFEKKINAIIHQMINTSEGINTITDFLQELLDQRPNQVKSNTLSTKTTATVLKTQQNITFEQIMSKHKSRGFKNKDSWW